VPVQTLPQNAVEWQALRLSGQEPLAVRASKKLRNDELLVTAFAGTSLRRELDRVPLWRGNHVGIRQLAEDFARYVYVPRLADPAVLSSAIQDGLGLLTWEKDSFAYADDFDEKADRYRGLRHSKLASLSPDAPIGTTGVGDQAPNRFDERYSEDRWSGNCYRIVQASARTAETWPQTLPWQRHSRSDPSRPRRRSHRRRDRFPSEWIDGLDRQGHPGDRGRNSERRTRSGRPYSDRELPHVEIHKPGI
jgi:hypothetical protein